MTRTRSLLIVGFIAIVLSVVLGSSPFGAPKLQRWEPKPPVTITYTVVEPCVLKDKNGNDVEKLRVRRSMPIQWVNKTQGPVTIKFEPPTIVGREDIYLNPGESYVTTITRIPSKGQIPSVTVICDGQIGSTPKMEECPPDTSDCP